MTHPHAAKLEEIEARLNAAVHAEWVADDDDVCANHNGTFARVAFINPVAEFPTSTDRAVTDFIARAPTDIRLLLDIARQALSVADGRELVGAAQNTLDKFDALTSNDSNELPPLGLNRLRLALQGKPITRKEMP